MLWIGLAVGSVIGVVVFLLIKVSDWANHQLPGSRNTAADALPRRALQPWHVAPHAQRRDAAVDVVEKILAELGELRTDVLWSITNSALWDVAVLSSRSFFTSLTVWEDHRSGWTVEETVAAAAELKVLWRAALDSATRLGISHLAVGDRPKADTALKLVRKANSTESDAERHQLMAKAAEVLSGIMSITIPRETMRAIERGANPPELEDPPHGSTSPTTN